MDQPNGENLGNFMKQPKLSNLKIDEKGTKALRKVMARSKSIKITINVENDSLTAIKEMASDTGVPYQRLLNQLLKEAIKKRSQNENRLDKLEKELSKINQKLKSVA